MWRHCPMDRNFMACTDGRVQNINTGHVFESPDTYGTINRGNKPALALHRMVLATFKDGYHKVWMPWCDHVEGVGAGNHIANLRWSNHP